MTTQVKRTSTIQIDWEKLVEAIYNLRDKKTPELSFSDFCVKIGCTDAGIYRCAREGRMWAKLVRTLKKAKIDIKEFQIQ